MAASSKSELLPNGTLEALGDGTHPTPHEYLGEHKYSARSWVVRVRRPLAKTVTLLYGDDEELELAHKGHGIWQASTHHSLGAYLIRAVFDGGQEWTADDPYRFTATLGEVDLYLLGEGRHEQLWKVLGANQKEHQGTLGTSFAVWAPHAKAVRVVGDFNEWDGPTAAMRKLNSNGYWEIFIPANIVGSAYKFEILTASGKWKERADPMAKFAEIPPANASKVVESSFVWGDESWRKSRSSSPHLQPISVYELHLGSWKPGLNYRELAEPLVQYVTEMGFTHVEFLPLAEHPYGGSWGYQVTGYFAPTSRFGDPDSLRYLIDRLHQSGIGVILDWVPAHFPKDEWALANFDGQPLYEYADPRIGEHPDWGTLVFDFGRREVRNFLVANALYWIDEFHVDGLRVDAVASMLYLDYSRQPGQWRPNIFGGRENLEAIDLIKEVNATAYKHDGSILMIAEESTAFPGVTTPTDQGGLGFGFKWNMGWMHDSLDYFSKDPLYRHYHHGELVDSLNFAFSENYVLPISHDEVVHGKGSLLSKMPGDHRQKLAGLRSFLAFQWSYPGKKLLFMGQEFGQPAEWSEERGLEWWMLEQPVHDQLRGFVASLNRLYRQCPALWSRDHDSTGFSWIDRNNAQENVIAYLRWPTEGKPIAIVLNLSGVQIDSYRLCLPSAGRWAELMNSDAIEFGGSGSGNLGSTVASEESSSGIICARITVPALTAIWFTPEI